MAGIMDFFTSSSSTKQDPVTPPADTKQSAVPDTTNSDPNKIPGTGVTPVNPLDVYSKMFDNKATSDTDAPPAFKLDPKVLGEVSNSMDLTQGINQEIMQRALAGDAKSLLDIIQSVGRNAYRASLEHTTTLTDAYLGQRSSFDDKRLQAGIHSQLTQNELASTPNFEHPVIKAELNRVAAQYAAANPDASPLAVAQAAKKYITDLSNALNPTTKTENDVPPDQVDWSKYLS